jgi:hypothetical protein
MAAFRGDDVLMLAAILSAMKSLPTWTKYLLLGSAVLAGQGIVRALYRRERWRLRIVALILLLSFIGINSLWGIPGLLIAFGVLGGLVVWDAVCKAEASESRRRQRLLSAVEHYLGASHGRYRDYQWAENSGGGMDFNEWLKHEHDVESDWQLRDRWDEDGVTVEDIHRWIDEVNRKREADGIARKGKTESKDLSAGAATKT